MPYAGISDSKLPSYVKKLSDPLKRKWVEIFNSTYAAEGEKMAFIVANKWLERKVKEKKTVARSENTIERVQFVVDDSTEFLVRSENGETFISAVLATTKKQKDGVALPEEVLIRWAEQINKELPVGDVDHQFYERVLQQNLSDDDIKIKLRNKPGIVKTVKAIYEKGKLWLRLLVDKRYKKALERAKGLSIEALLTKNEKGDLVDADFLGFTTCIDSQTADPEAVIA